MRRAPWCALALSVLLAACVDFVDPVGLGLARDTRVEVTLGLVDDPRRSSCPGTASPPADPAVLCVRATVVPGVNRLGERLRVLDDTLRALGIALAPQERSDSLLRYEHGFALPRASLEEIPLTVTLPRIEGVEIQPREIRWFPVGRVGPDTLIRSPEAGVSLRVDPPGGASTPRPTQEFWNMTVSADTVTVGYNAFGVPRPRYDFPAEVLNALSGSRFVGDLRWLRSYQRSQEGLQVNVYFDQRLRWTVLTR